MTSPVLPKLPLQPSDPIKTRPLSLQTSWVTTVYVAWDESAQVFYLLVNARVLSVHRHAHEAERAYKKLTADLSTAFEGVIHSRLT